MTTTLIKSANESDQKRAIAVISLAFATDPLSRWIFPDPHQGRGYGSALMRHALTRCDRENKLAYLESSNTRNIPLYERYGFGLLATIQIGSAPPVFPMLRQAGVR